MFKLDVSDSYWWPVSFQTPSEASGAFEAMDFKVRFRRMATEPFEDLMKRAEQQRLSDSKLAREVVLDWAEVVGAGGPVAFNDESFGRLLSVAGAGSAIMLAFFESRSKGAAKN